MQITGTIKKIGETQTFGQNGFRKREIVITTNEQYPQTLMVEFTQDRAELLNNYTPGQQVNISINLRGREWVNPQGETKYFNSLNGWNISVLQENTGGANTQNTPPPAAAQNQNSEQGKEEDDEDLPF